jgi:MFS family permease
MTNINKKFGVDNHINENILNTLVTVFSIVNGFSRLGIGILSDYYSLKLIIIAILSCDVNDYFNKFLISCSIFFIVQYEYLYLVYNIMIAITYGGQFCVFPNLFNKVFGTR